MTAIPVPFEAVAWVEAQIEWQKAYDIGRNAGFEWLVQEGKKERRLRLVRFRHKA